MWPFGKSGDVFDATFGAEAGEARKLFEPEPAASSLPVVASSNLAPWRFSFDDGEKFAGGFGATEILIPDYWTLRKRSAQLFEQNLYARGLIRRLITNEINVGLHLECTPEEGILGLEKDSLAEWTESVENRFSLWAAEPRLCDQNERMTFGALQAAARSEALVAGDVLVVLRQDQRTMLPRVQLINGACVQTPRDMMLSGQTRGGNRVVHGVELDGTGRHLAYWVDQKDGTSKRMPATGEKSGRRLAWLVYGTDRRLDDVRGKPILALVLQSLKEIDRYRDSTQRKAVINSMLAMFIKKGQDKAGTLPITGGAIRRGSDTTVDTTGKTRSFRAAEQIPGLVLEELQQGEEPQAFATNGTTEAFGIFEEAVIQSIAWANNVPPEILTLSYSSNYSASQAANNDFKIYLDLVRTDFGDNFCRPLYIEWLLAEVLAKKIDAPGLLEAWRDPALYDSFGAWVSCDWSGNIKPAIKLSDLVTAYGEMAEKGFITRARAARELTGTRFAKNVQQLRLENEQLAQANKPLEPPPPAVAPAAPPSKPNDGGAGAPQEDDAEDPEDAAAPLRVIGARKAYRS